jgi:hypothetical protein
VDNPRFRFRVSLPALCACAMFAVPLTANGALSWSHYVWADSRMAIYVDGLVSVSSSWAIPSVADRCVVGTV